ncbi:MAG: hypothetical protein CME63_14800 [Halobacteriovoraceae bacterium]|nr:hypothetical protein [Halobacteriovoraceae bacterium]
MKEISVCQITTWISGGAGIAASRLNESLNLLNAEVKSKLLTKSKKEDLKDSQASLRSYHSEILSRIKYMLLSKNCISNNKNNYEFFSYFETGYRPDFEEFDIIHLHWVSNFIDLKSLIKKYSHKKIVWTLHDLNPFLGGLHYSIDLERISSDLREYEKKLMLEKHKIIKGKGIHFNFLSKWLYEEALKFAPWLSNEDCSFSVNGMDISSFQVDDREKTLESLGMDPSKRNVLFISESISNYRKGADLLFQALGADFTNNHNIQLHAIGKKDLENEYPHINFVGRINDFSLLQKYYLASDFFILPSRQDNLPNVMLESLCSGCPVISFKTGGMKEWISDRNGILSEEISSDGLQKAVEMAFQRNFDRNEISKTAKENFNSIKATSLYSDLYRRLCRK